MDEIHWMDEGGGLGLGGGIKGVGGRHSLSLLSLSVCVWNGVEARQ